MPAYGFPYYDVDRCPPTSIGESCLRGPLGGLRVAPVDGRKPRMMLDPSRRQIT